MGIVAPEGTWGRLADRHSTRVRVLETLAAYGVGIPASFWLIERIAGF